MAEFLGLTEEELQLFLDEMKEHLETLESDLLAAERDGTSEDGVARLFRAAHTIKGAAATVGLDGMTKLTHAMETFFEEMRSGHRTAEQGAVTLLLSAVDVLSQSLADLEMGSLPDDPPEELLAALERLEKGEYAAVEQQTAPANQSGEGLRVSVQFAEACEMPAVRALQVIKALDKVAQVLACQPSEDDIKAGKVGVAFSAEVIPAVSIDELETAVAKVPDVVEATVTEADAESFTDVETEPEAAMPNEDQHPVEMAADKPRPTAGTRNGEDRTIRVDVALLDDLMNLVGELVIDRGRLAGIGQSVTQGERTETISEELGRVTAHLARVTGNLQETVLKARMLPVERVFRKFPRMVRDLGQQIGKEVDFSIHGEETELDRSLLEVIGDPLMHLLRNALDHGLESPEERRAAGKPQAGRLQLIAAYEENQVVILVQDDGRGIDAAKVIKAAVQRGLVATDRAGEITPQEAMQFMFAPGFSTRETVTDISGRGVGLDVVRRNIERVGGQIEVESELGVGTTFRLLLPLTLATIQALLVKVGEETLALPLGVIAEVFRVSPEALSSVRGRWVTRLRDRVVPLLWLDQFMHPRRKPTKGREPLLTVLVNYKGELTGLVVDQLLGEQEVVVKGLGEFLGQMRGINGVTILGDGNLALILDPAGMISLLASESLRAG